MRHDNEVTPRDFIRIWQSSKSAKEAYGRLGMKPSAAASRAHHYRLKGIPLKRWRRHRTDWVALAEYAARLRVHYNHEDENNDPA